ncbi:MAG: hypothetical protein U5L07_00040 [Desulfobacterales bacterium]|nr:hypothetical protein [Desulfobacterales bacterium]
MRDINNSNRKIMEMKQTIFVKKLLSIFIFIALLTQISACGYLLHPDRRGQTGGRIDVGIVALDGIGLLFFLVPGIIAFAVDFSTGCIYLPGGRFSAIPDNDEIRVIQVDPAELNEAAIKKIIIRETGVSAGFDLNRAQVYALNGSGDVPGRFAAVKKPGYHHIR